MYALTDSERSFYGEELLGKNPVNIASEKLTVGTASVLLGAVF